MNVAVLFVRARRVCRRAVPGAVPVLLVLSGLKASAQRPQAQAPPLYSTTPAYRSMIDNIRSAAPSPAFIATGHLPQPNATLQVVTNDTPKGLTLTSASARYVLGRQDGALTITDRKSSTSWTFSVAQPEGCTAAGAVKTTLAIRGWTATLPSTCGVVSLRLEILSDGLARMTVGRDTPAGAAVPAAGELTLHVLGGGPYFGLGERFWQAGLSATTLDVRPQDRAGEPGHNWVYVAVPLVYDPAGLGIYADTAFDAKFRFNQADTSFDMTFAEGPVPLYLFTEADPKAVLSAYTGMTGRPQDPPLWTFGPWITALGGKGAVLDVARRIRTDAVPASALWIYDQNDEKDNLGWPFWFASYYGDPRTFVDTLHGLGFRVLTYVHPYVRAEIVPYTLPSPQYQRGILDRLLQTGADGKPAGPRFEDVSVGNVDFTNPQAVDWWQGMITAAVQTQDFDGWMEDFGEWVRDSDRFAAGTGRKLSELYPLLYHKITLAVAQALKPTIVPFSRSGSPGSQAFSPVLWGADQQANWSRDYGLPSVVTAGITAGMSGFSTWGPDILSTGSNRDLWQRWVEFGALCPVMRDHVWDRPSGSFNIFSDAATTAHFRRWAAFHASLLPYLATYAEEAQRTGIPIMRHPVLEFPDDPRAAAAEYEYLLGHEMLVAPIVQGGQTLRLLYLPRGEWVNFWNGDFLTGGQDVTVDASSIPILVRAGSILPFKPEEEAAQWNWDDPHLLTSSLIWRVYPSSTGLADTTFALVNGTSAHLEQRGSQVLVTGSSATTRAYEVIVRSRQAPTSVRLNGAPFPAYTPGPDGRAAAQWWWNPGSAEIHMIFRGADFKIEVQGTYPTQYGS